MEYVWFVVIPPLQLLLLRLLSKEAFYKVLKRIEYEKRFRSLPQTLVFHFFCILGILSLIREGVIAYCVICVVSVIVLLKDRKARDFE